MRIYVRVRIFLKTSVCICMFIINMHPLKKTIFFAKKLSFDVAFLAYDIPISGWDTLTLPTQRVETSITTCCLCNLNVSRLLGKFE